MNRAQRIRALNNGPASTGTMKTNLRKSRGSANGGSKRYRKPGSP